MNEKIFSHVTRMAEKDSIYRIEVYCSVEWNQIEVRRDHEGVSKSLSTVEETDPMHVTQVRERWVGTMAC